MDLLTTVPLLATDDLGMRKLLSTAAEDFLEVVKRCYDWTSTQVTIDRQEENCGKLLGDGTVVTPMVDRLLRHRHVLKFSPCSWRIGIDSRDQEARDKLDGLGLVPLAGFEVTIEAQGTGQH
jgi:DNA replication protein DnaC